jgi:hypothetical protein
MQKTWPANMATVPEMIMDMHKRQTETRFALFVKDQTPEAIEFSIPLLTLERHPKMTDREFAQLLEENRQRYCAPIDKRLLRRARPSTTRADAAFDLEEPGAI